MLMRANAQHPNVKVIYGNEFFPERKEAHVLYLSGNPGKPLAVACQLNPERFKLLQTFVREGGHRVIGYNAASRSSVGL